MTRYYCMRIRPVYYEGEHIYLTPSGELAHSVSDAHKFEWSPVKDDRKIIEKLVEKLVDDIEWEHGLHHLEVLDVTESEEVIWANHFPWTLRRTQPVKIFHYHHFRHVGA